MYGMCGGYGESYMPRWLAIIALMLTANAFTVPEASAWYISQADAERLCVGKPSKHYQWGYSCAWCGEGLLHRCLCCIARQPFAFAQ